MLFIYIYDLVGGGHLRTQKGRGGDFIFGVCIIIYTVLEFEGARINFILILSYIGCLTIHIDRTV